MHNQQSLKNRFHSNLTRTDAQRGSSIVLALFVIIILTLLGSALMRMISTSSETVSQEVLGTRAYMAANSAMQAELQQLFPLNNTVGVCNASNIITYDFQDENTDIPGLYDCEATTTCDNYYSDSENDVEYYRLTSTGKCGTGAMNSDSKVIVKSSRTIQIEARSL
ncbi:pilus assembly PilX N-terminal domain-containing protein [Colwellia sp. E2M01]|uniref:pilus assembly PilX N-terminal domain-containing protein n=1 Tax=Colwellia sp. E2M01 TaxID=2841561 RepID=UPI001C0A1CFE|nr:pilus assembly PilX N-terminal domain-containing protein [Colwellia sp. E2M01]MBU2870299.1 pilus assembly PilX N-terminal domain-containing protein [Colwellia sp. E2M01]